MTIQYEVEYFPSATITEQRSAWNLFLSNKNCVTYVILANFLYPEYL